VPRVFVEKCFVVSIFGHTFYVHFSKIFRVLCKVESKYNKFILENNTVIIRAYWSDKKWRGKSDFFDRKKA